MSHHHDLQLCFCQAVRIDVGVGIARGAYDVNPDPTSGFLVSPTVCLSKHFRSYGCVTEFHFSYTNLSLGLVSREESLLCVFFSKTRSVFSKRLVYTQPCSFTQSKQRRRILKVQDNHQVFSSSKQSAVFSLSSLISPLTSFLSTLRCLRCP